MFMGLFLRTVLVVEPNDGGDIDSFSLSISLAPGVNLGFYLRFDLRYFILD